MRRFERVRHHLAEHAEFYWAPVLYAAAVCYLYWEVLAGEAGFGWDTIESYWPDLVYLSERLRAGDVPLWNPFDRGGYPYAADPQPGMYYPVHWLFVVVSAVVGDTTWSVIQVKMLLHHAIAGVCVHAFIRHRGLPRAAAVVGGVALVASSPWLIHKASNLLLPMVWTPLIFIAIDRMVAAPSWRRAVALAGALYLSGSAGSPPGFFYVLVMATAYGAFRVVETALARRRDGAAWRFGGHLALAVAGAAALAIGLLWVGVAPALELIEHTPRANRGPSYALSLPLPMWSALRGLIVPTAGAVDAYCGIVVMMLCACALVLRRAPDRGTPVFFAAVAGAFMVLSFGPQLPVLGFLVERVPGFGLFRIASRYKCLFAPMVACLAGYGAANLLWVRPRFCSDTWKVIGVVVVFACLVACLLYAYPLDKRLAQRFPGPATPIVLSLLGAGLLIGAAVHHRRGAAVLVAVMPIVILSDPQRYWHHQQLILEAKVDHRQDLAVIRSLDGVLEHRFRVYDEFVLEQRAGSRLQIRDFRGYPSGDPLDLERYRDVLRKAATHPQLLEAYNVRYVLYGRHHRNGLRVHRVKRDPAASSPAHFARGQGPVREARHPAALVQWVGGAVVQDRANVLDAVLRAESPTGDRPYAVLEPSARDALGADVVQQLQANQPTAPPSVAGRLISFEPDRVVVAVDAPTAGLVVLNELNYPGWSPYVDGERRPGATANYLLRAVAVGAGPHQIEWRYEPPGHRWRWALYWLCMLVVAAAAVYRDRP